RLGYKNFTDENLTKFYRAPSLLGELVSSKMGFSGQEHTDVGNAIIKALSTFNSPEAFIAAMHKFNEQADAEGTFDPNQRGEPKDRNAQMNVSIDKIEVVSDDVDKFAMEMEQTFNNALKNPTQAEVMIRTGL